MLQMTARSRFDGRSDCEGKKCRCGLLKVQLKHMEVGKPWRGCYRTRWGLERMEKLYG